MKALLPVLMFCLAIAVLPAVGDQEFLVLPEEAAVIPAAEAEVEPDAPTEEATPEEDDPTLDEPVAPKPAEPGVLRFHLMDGTVITGKLITKTLPINTEFGQLIVPIDSIESFSPGLSSHTEIDKKIKALIEQLGNPDAKSRDKAQAELQAYGPGLIPTLRDHSDDPDAERKVRIATITESLLAIETDDFEVEQGPVVSLARLDHVVTERFTIAGKIEQDTFNIKSKFGELVVKLQDIKGVERSSTEKPEQRRTVEVSGTDMTCRGYKTTGIRVNRGDRIIISAEGQVTMSPWGSNSVSSPDGIPQNGMYNGKIPMGALAGRIGDSGEEFLVGRKNTFVAKKSGVLQLGFAMQQNWANYQFPGSYKARIRVVPAQ